MWACYTLPYGKDRKKLNQIFTSQTEQRLLSFYRRVFSIKEIESSRVLQWVFGALLFGFYVTFDNWVLRPGLTVEAFASNKYLCWPYFQNCGIFNILSVLPYGYSQTILYAFFLGVMFLAVYLAWKKDWVLAHMAVVVLFIWEFLVMFVFSAQFSGNYDYYHVILGLIFLFFPHKDFFLKITFVVLYFLAGTIKIHEGWILGTYFSSLTTGIPIFPNWSIPFFTNFVTFLEICGSWLLFSSRKVLQRGAMFFFVLFHLYSTSLVAFHYPAIVMPFLLILFGPLFAPPDIPHDRRVIIGWAFVGLLFIFHFSSVFILGDVKMTNEGNKFGLYMFEANHQCISRADVYKDGEIIDRLEKESISARNRCDPYTKWFFFNQMCKRDTEIERIQWTFDHSINGGLFYRIVDVENACALTYRTLGHNAWIKTPKEGAPVIGRPVENIFK
ncbi:MAG: hypothetical protein Greene07144_773 [Parcubacteria group bacterium Greene0714_4]|nr:MAG: hypothetical protein Greene07144_773 [Parcubacteria group bacterium Greene0714_4]